MRFLLDENTHGDLGRALSALGHDAIPVLRTVSDETILAQAVAENRALITHDRDFGDLIVRQRLPHRGVLYLRFSNALVDFAVERIQAALAAGYPEDAFLVITDRSIRRQRI
jgi:predicted nuclease of predicted toxin-antitoxin system